MLMSGEKSINPRRCYTLSATKQVAALPCFGQLGYAKFIGGVRGRIHGQRCFFFCQDGGERGVTDGAQGI
jgi:hypothetical protein